MTHPTRPAVLAATAAATVALTAGIGLPLASAADSTTGTVTTPDQSNLHVRAEANTSSDIVTKLPPGSSADVTCWTTGDSIEGQDRTTDIWYRTDEGYISAAFFARDNADAHVPTCSEQGSGADSAAPVADDEYSDISYERATPEVKEWIGQARKIMIDAGTDPALIRANDLAIVAMHESNGDPDSLNDWDSNAAAGTPSKGLMQTIQPTFDAHAMEGHTDINDPVDNIIAASLYMIDRYGSSAETPGPASVNQGGSYRPY